MARSDALAHHNSALPLEKAQLVKERSLSGPSQHSSHLLVWIESLQYFASHIRLNTRNDYTVLPPSGPDSRSVRPIDFATS